MPTIVISRRDLGRLDALLGSTVIERIGKVGTFLLEEISRAQVVDDNAVPPTVVTMGSRVRFRDDETGRETVARLVYPSEAAGLEDGISVLTPVGAALLGLSQGQSMPYETRDGRQKSLTVIAILEDGDAGPAEARDPVVVPFRDRRRPQPRPAMPGADGSDPGPGAA